MQGGYLAGPVDQVRSRDRGRRPRARTGHGHRWRRRVERRRLGKHLGLEGAQCRSWVDSQLVGENRTSPAQRRESIRLTLGAVQRKDQEPPALLSQWVLGDQCFELTDEQGSLAQLETPLQ